MDLKLKQTSDSVSGQTVVDPKGKLFSAAKEPSLFVFLIESRVRSEWKFSII